MAGEVPLLGTVVTLGARLEPGRYAFIAQAVRDGKAKQLIRSRLLGLQASPGTRILARHFQNCQWRTHFVRRR